MSEIKEDSSEFKTIRDPLIEPFFITIDQYCYTLNTMSVPFEGGKSYLKSIGHYSDFDSCLAKITRLRVNNQNYNSIREYINEYKRLIDELKTLTKI